MSTNLRLQAFAWRVIVNGVVACIHAWWHTDRTPEVDPLAEDQAALETSRQRILATADRVVPGHGEPFEAGRSS
jgi:glyoxylase-like metal-dependent hydrolase (beta-lactamase superfamily II)